MRVVSILAFLAQCAFAFAGPPQVRSRADAHAPNVTTFHIVWVGGQSNSVGTNSQTGGYPTWPTTPLIQMFCWGGQRGCTKGSFAPAATPVYGESNVGFSLTFANLLLQTLPPGHGVIIINTGVGGTGFHDGNWAPPNGRLAVQSVAAVTALSAAFPSAFPGAAYSFHAMLWHQGELDAGDNAGAAYHADYCTYLINDLSALVDFFRAAFPGASVTTPFIDGQLLPYWIDAVVGGTGEVPAAINSLNTSRACTGTADSRVFADMKPDGSPNGDPNYRSGVSGDVIHFDATQNIFLGFQYWQAYLRAVALTTPVPSAQTLQCPNSTVQKPVKQCG